MPRSYQISYLMIRHIAPFLEGGESAKKGKFVGPLFFIALKTHRNGTFGRGKRKDDLGCEVETHVKRVGSTFKE